ncbi:MAG TPA: HEAT repeat domain-containing protein [Gemmatimonadaceae bacterium]|nr:HEAT repeat domain-containing protein [Gemmatimonadaceae bacterium]
MITIRVFGIARRAPTPVAVLAGVLLAGAPGLQGQSISQRVAAVHDGTVRLAYATRPGICGDGSAGGMRLSVNGIVIASRSGTRASGDPEICYAGPAHVALRREGGETVSIRIRMGAPSSAADSAVDLGLLSAPEAARYFLAESIRIPGRTGDDALDAAAIADSVALWPDLARLARNTDVREDTRKHAVFWMATYDDGAAHDTLRAVVRDAAIDEGVRGAAIIALANDDISDEDVRFLRALYPTLSTKLRDDVFLAVSRSESPSAGAWLASVVTDTSQSEHARKQALFWLGQGRSPTGELVALKARLHDPDIRRHYTFVLSQRHDAAALDALMDLAQHDPERDVRRQALFWLGQSHDPRAVKFLEQMVLR